MASAPQKSAADCSRWIQHVHSVQTQRSPEACEAARQTVERARQHEVSYRKCKAVKSHAVRSRALCAEGLRQMSVSEAPMEHLEVQARWKSAQMASKCQQDEDMCRAEAALAAVPMGSRSSRRSAPMEVLRSVEVEENEAMERVADLMGAEDVSVMAAVGNEGLRPPPDSISSSGRRVATNVATAAPVSDVQTVEALIAQLRVEPSNETECAAKFQLYEGYGQEVEEMRSSLLKFHSEHRTSVPAAIAREMDQKVQRIDTQEAMGIPERAREWFVFHMMRQAQRNNLNMASILDGFEKKLEFLAKNDQVECPVCLENFSIDGAHSAETLECCHKVCKDCWDNWSTVTNGRPFCPLCRHDAFLGAVQRRVGAPGPAADFGSDDEF